MLNPWESLTKNPPYIAECDKQNLENSYFVANLKLNVMPEPFIGNIEAAQIVFLLLNPGFEEADIKLSTDHPDFIEQNRKNLTHRSDYPFYVLDEKFSYSGAYKWWNKRLRTLFEYFKKHGKNHVIRKIMCIQYFPYHSKKYKDLGLILESQKYSFSLVQKAIINQKLIIVMRSEKQWLKAVPELKNYPYIPIKNVRSPYVTKNNMTAEQFKRLMDALED